MSSSFGRTLCLSVCFTITCLALVSVSAEEQDANPYRTAKVGDWVKYEVEVENSFAPFSYVTTNTVTAIDGEVVKITQNVKYHDGNEKQFHKQVDRSRPLPLNTLLGYDRPHNLRVVKTDTGSETITIAGRQLQTVWSHYDVGRGSSYPGEKQIWISSEVPLDGVVKLQTISKGRAGSISTSTLIAFGRNGADHRREPTDEEESTTSVNKEPGKWTNSVGMQLVRIHKGHFTMGALPREEFDLLAFEERSVEDRLDLLGLKPPQRPVIIPRDYWISAQEVTVGQFRQFIAATGYKTDAERDGRGGTGKLPSGRFGSDSEFNWQEYGFPIEDTFPVVNVSWRDANAFCKWLSKQEGHKYRLPSEAEWEYACRAGTTTRYNCGDDISDLAGYANVADQSLARATPGLPWAAPFDDGVAYLAPVGKFKPNAFGLYDMHGNALEWCGNRFSFFDPLEDLDPPPQNQVVYCVRGGNWFNEPARAGCASRSGAEPTTRMSLIGFRVVRQADD